uniref:Uncharacterized protein n=1 Tax=Anopheles atroparvus TaxID=41427 RepID=A0A182J373_ANOAO
MVYEPPSGKILIDRSVKCELTSTELTTAEALSGEEAGRAEGRHLAGSGPWHAAPGRRRRRQCTERRWPDWDVTGGCGEGGLRRPVRHPERGGRPGRALAPTQPTLAQLVLVLVHVLDVHDGVLLLVVSSDSSRLCGVSARSGSPAFCSEAPSGWERGEQELVVCEDRLAGIRSPEEPGEVPGRDVVVVVVAETAIAGCRTSAPCGPCSRWGGVLCGVCVCVGVVLVVMVAEEVMMAWWPWGVLGRVSASSDATLKLLIRELLFCCMGTVGLVIAIRTGVTALFGLNLPWT